MTRAQNLVLGGGLGCGQAGWRGGDGDGRRDGSGGGGEDGGGGLQDVYEGRRARGRGGRSGGSGDGRGSLQRVVLEGVRVHPHQLGPGARAQGLLYKAHAERRVSRVHVRDVVRVLLVEGVRDEVQGAAQERKRGPAGLGGWPLVALAAEESRALERLQREEDLVAVRLHQVPFQGLVLARPQAAALLGQRHQAKQPQDTQQRLLAGDAVVQVESGLVRVRARQQTLLGFQLLVELGRLRELHELLREARVHRQRRDLGLVRRDAFGVVAYVRDGGQSLALVVELFEHARAALQGPLQCDEVQVPQLCVHLVVAVQQHSHFFALQLD